MLGEGKSKHVYSVDVYSCVFLPRPLAAGARGGLLISAFGPKADMPKNAIDVAIGGKADMPFCTAYVRF
jgi:hypothetical protein